MKKLFIIGIVLLLLVATFFWFQKQKEKSSEAIHPHRKNIIEAIYGLGTVTANRTFSLKVGITTTIQKIYVHEGQKVFQDQPLVSLSGSGIFKAPFSGTITTSPYKGYETIYPQTLILTLTDLKNLYLTVSLEQQSALRVEPGQTVRFHFENFLDQPFIGKVRSIFPQEGQFIVHIEVGELPDKILPGMTADVAIEISQHENALLIPAKSLSDGKVRVKKNGKESLEAVKLGIIEGEWVEVLSENLSENDWVILKK